MVSRDTDAGAHWNKMNLFSKSKKQSALESEDQLNDGEIFVIEREQAHENLQSWDSGSSWLIT